MSRTVLCGLMLRVIFSASLVSYDLCIQVPEDTNTLSACARSLVALVSTKRERSEIKIQRSDDTAMPLHYAGLNPSSLYAGRCTIETFTELPFEDVTDVYIDWNYLLLWRYTELWITGAIGKMIDHFSRDPMELKIPDSRAGRCLLATGGTESVTILTSNNDIWQYMLYEETWRRIPRFIPGNDEAAVEEIVKLEQGKGPVVALTNLGRVFNIPSVVDTPKNVKFVDIACGIEHTLMLTNNGDVYSMGLGTRGQLGHGDLEDCDEPRLIEALAGLGVSQISASGWCSAVVTNEGDLYMWGWNNEGQMGLSEDQKLVAVPMFVDFKDGDGKILDLRIVKVQCTSSCIVCLTEDGELWGCGSNKYGQLGQETTKLSGTKTFVKMPIDLDGKCVKDIKCRARGTLIVSSRNDSGG